MSPKLPIESPFIPLSDIVREGSLTLIAKTYPEDLEMGIFVASGFILAILHVLEHDDSTIALEVGGCLYYLRGSREHRTFNDLKRSLLLQASEAVDSARECPWKVSVNIRPSPQDASSEATLILHLIRLSNGLQGKAFYDATHLDSCVAKALVEATWTILEAAAADPTLSADRVHLITSSSCEDLLLSLSGAKVKGPEPVCIHDAFARVVATQPQAVAIIAPGIGSFTYQELDQQANRIANRLRDLGVRPGVLIALLFDRSVEMLVAILGVLKSGGAYVPVDPQLPRERISIILSRSEPLLILCPHAYIKNLPEAEKVPVATYESLTAVAQLQAGEPRLAVVHTNDPAYVIFTSGSSGKPKGAVLAHRGVFNMVMAHEDVLGPKPTLLQFYSFSFDASIFECFGALLLGGTLVLERRDELLDPQNLAGLIETYNITSIQLPPTILESLPIRDYPSLRTIFVGGEVYSPTLIERWGATKKVINVYGPTECTVCSSLYTRRGSEMRLPIGRPLPGVFIYVLDEVFKPVPIGIPGEIYVGGAGVGLGYIGEPSHTAERFIPDPFVKAGVSRGLLYRTGDRGQWRLDGHLEFLGRADRQVKVRGFRLDPLEIENALEAHPGVREAAVVPHKDPWMELRLVAYVNLRDGISLAEIRRYLGARLPQYMLPTAWAVVPEFPRTDNHKLDRNQLAPPNWVRDVPVNDVFYGNVERVVADAWTSVLSMAPGTHNDFLEAGGDSISAMRIVARIQTSLAVRITVSDVFRAATALALAALIRERGFEVKAMVNAPFPHWKRHDRERIPLSSAQQRLWAMEQLMPGATYNLTWSYRICGLLNVPSLLASLRDLVERHEILRTRFPVDNFDPYQDVVPVSYTQDTRILNLTLMTPKEAEQERRRAIEHLATTPHMLDEVPPFITLLIIAGPEDYELVMAAHHILLDAWSTRIISEELSLLYAVRIGQSFSVLRPAAQFSDISITGTRALQCKQIEDQLQWWKQKLAPPFPVLPLPGDRVRPTQRSGIGRRIYFNVDAAITECLERIALNHSTSLFMVLVSAYFLLLYKISGERDLLVGTPVAVRGHSDLEGAIGFLVNTIVLRLGLNPTASFVELLAAIRTCALEAFARQDVPFEWIVQEIAPERSTSYAPIFQAFFVYQSISMASLSIPGASCTIAEHSNGTAKFDLHLELSQGLNGLQGWIEYPIDIFEEWSIRRIAERYTLILEKITREPSITVDDLSVLTPVDAEVLALFNNTTVKRNYTTSIYHFLRFQAEERPHAVAVFDDNHSVTYTELLKCIDRLAYRLRLMGIGSGSRVGLFIERSADTIVSAFASLKVGAAFVPIDTDYPFERWFYILEDAQPNIVITQGPLLPRLKGVEVPVVVIDGDRLGLDVEAVSAATWSRDDIAYIIYTSGSTGRPKGAMNTYAGLLNRLMWMQEAFPLGHADRILHKTPSSFDVSIWELLWFAIAGAAVVVTRPGGERDPAYLSLVIQRFGVTTLHFVPSMLRLFLQDPGVAKCSSLKRIISSGEALSQDLAQLTCKMLRAEIFNLYGPAETAIDVTWWHCRIDEITHPVPIGQPISNTQIHILDDCGRSVPIGTPGEICIGGVGVGLGYFNRPSLTCERFVPNPFHSEPGSRLYRTGDRGRWVSSGIIEYLGRLDFQIKLRGVRIEPGEIEATLLRIPWIHDVAVLARLDQSGDETLAAYIILDGEWERSGQIYHEKIPAELTSLLRESLPDVMVPSSFTILDRMPLTPNGKIDRLALETIPIARVTSGSTPPRTKLEAQVLKVWCEILGHDAIGIHDDFFAVGGHSLSATRLIMCLRERFDLNIPVRSLFEVRTVAGIAREIDLRQRVGELAKTREPYIDLVMAAESSTITPPLARFGQPNSTPRRILVTGATGFLGAYLVRQLADQTEAEIVCLIRAANEHIAKPRLIECLKRHGVWDASLEARVYAFPGDLAEPRLGLGNALWQHLTCSIDTIYHSGAWVNFIEPYARLEPVNVGGTRTILNLTAEGQPKVLHYISSSSVYGTVGYFTGRTVIQEDEPIDIALGYGFGGYIQTKWVAEKAVQLAINAGLPAAIYRCALIMGHSKTGQTNIRDFPSRLIKGCIERESYYLLRNKYDNFIPVDFAAAAIVHLSLQQTLLGKAFHVVNPHHIEYSAFFDIIASFGYRLQPIPYRQWIEDFLRDIRETEQNALFPLIPLFFERVSSVQRSIVELFEETPVYSTENLKKGLTGSGIECPRIDQELVGTWLKYYVESGFLPVPNSTRNQHKRIS